MKTNEARNIPRGLNQVWLMDRFGGDEKLICELVGIFEKESSKLIAALRGACAIGDAPEIERAAHTLKGSVGNFGAGDVFGAALELEDLGREKRLEAVPAALRKLEAELQNLSRELYTSEPVEFRRPGYGIPGQA